MLSSVLLAAPIVTCSLSAAEPVTTGRLLGEMTDMAGLARFPDPPYKTVQFSSYDRASVAPYAPGWYANNDGFGGEETPNFLAVLQKPGADGVGRYLLAEVEGPGAIVRTWTAAINGDVAVYLDGETKPLYEGGAARFLGETYRALAGLTAAGGEVPDDGFRQRDSCYFPIPFARSLRIEWTGKVSDIHFYHLETRCYPPGTDARTFALEDLTTYRDELAAAQAVLARPDAAWRPPGPGRTVPIGAELAPDEPAELAAIEGPGAIQELQLRLAADDLHPALRQVILRGYFDGAPQPQIEAPLGDFFGSGPGVSPYDSLPMTVRPDGTMVCRFAMPFATSARFVAENLGTVPARVSGQASVADWAWDGRSLHLHARWRVDHGLLADEPFDLPFVSARGRGVYVGTAVMLLNPTRVPTSAGNWWGEGDEKVWVDDDTFPSLFGTGSEDYFNYAWSVPDLFHYAYCAQPLDTGPDNRGFVANSRWHILDALPFAQRLDFCMELMHHTRTPDLTYARLGYFYATPEVRDDCRPITQADVRQGLQLPANWEPVGAGASRGAIFSQAEDLVAPGQPNVEVVEGRMWSAGKLVQWSPRAEGEKLELKLPVAEARRYQLVLTCALTPTSGRVAVSVDGGPSLEPVAGLFTPYHTMLRNVWLSAGEPSTLELAAGEHTVTLTAAGRNEASGGTQIGVDFVWLMPRD